MPERIPPHNLDAERSVLGAAMLSRDALADVSELIRPEDFYDSVNKEIYSTIWEMFKAGKSIDLVMHMEKWVEGKEYDRLGLSDEYITILGVKVPHQIMPVRPGRNLAIIIEVAARNLSLKRMGYSAAHELDRRLNEMIMKKSGQME